MPTQAQVRAWVDARLAELDVEGNEVAGLESAVRLTIPQLRSIEGELRGLAAATPEREAQLEEKANRVRTMYRLLAARADKLLDDTEVITCKH